MLYLNQYTTVTFPTKMRNFMVLIYLTYLIVVLIAVGCSTVQSSPEPMARPTRPKVFTSPEELREYLDLIRVYYTLSSKARYGKRGDPSIPTNHRLPADYPSDFLRTLIAVNRQWQQNQRMENEQLEKNDDRVSQLTLPYDRFTRYSEVTE
ncbi:hypothetical protein QAD02_022981 [Eretmocerus hayati]|uniref:Uncharacterized protein n=1 Tax=Eretmocerus hayati TaxID=131215 RepID=A0ACC2PUR7_9HYME|nr:hypothetical protein QAD02_022981 [Eretmocerus hayati]